MSDLLKIVENEVQLAALTFMVVVYSIRILWLFRFASRKERTFPAGNAKAGAALSMANILMPWSMESTRKNPLFYVQFMIFHIGVALAIGSTFIIPYGPDLFEIAWVVRVFQTVLGAAFLVGLYRLYRRLTNRSVRLVSTPDDYFSLILMIVYFGLGFISVPNNYQKAEWPLIVFFLLTAFFLIYVPFSKIGHYLYYPFTRYFLGRSLGHRGIYFKKRRIASETGE